MNTGREEDRQAFDHDDPPAAPTERERDAYREALEEILAQCRRAERDGGEEAYRVAVESQIPSYANEVLTIFAPEPGPVSDEELPF